MIHLKVIKVTNSFDKKFDYLANQIRRSSLSVILNIAEGSAKISDKDFNRYLEMAMGSVNETVAGLEVAQEMNLIEKDIFLALENSYSQIVNQLGGFSKKLRTS